MTILQVMSLLVVLVLSLIITRVATIALTLTGMTRESARFQNHPSDVDGDLLAEMGFVHSDRKRQPEEHGQVRGTTMLSVRPC